VGSGPVRRGRGSRPQSANGIDSANDVTGGIRRIGFADVGQSLWVTEDRQGFLELGQVLRAEDDGDRASVARDRDALVLVLDAIDDIAEVMRTSRRGSTVMDTIVARLDGAVASATVCCRVRAPKSCRGGSAFLR
jgi:hypothetical protein